MRFLKVQIKSGNIPCLYEKNAVKNPDSKGERHVIRMGELILCNQPLAALPYYLESAGLHIYSLEELCYYIENNQCLVGTELMSGELCGWVEKELGMKETAEMLHEICQKNGTLSEFVLCLLKASGYCSREKVQQIATYFQEMEHKSEYECGKIRADRYMQNGRYVNGIYEYRKLLQNENEKNPVLIGAVWHNMGCAYAKLFLFKEAADCYQKAYEQNGSKESLRECLYAYRCLLDKEGFDRTAKEYGLGEEEIKEIENRLHMVSGMEEIREFEQGLNDLFLAGREAEINTQIDEWKDTYRKNCKI